MIPSSAVEDFLRGKRDDHRWIKKLTHADLDSILADIRPRPQLWPTLHLHQKACVALGIAYPRFAFWCDMGSGKTLTTLELLKHWRACGALRRALVFVTSDKAFPTWEKQARNFKVGMPVVALDGSSEDKWRQLRAFGEGIVLVTYPGAVAMCAKRVTGRRRGKLQLDPKLVTKLAHDADALVLDESTRAGHHTSLTHRLCAMLSRRVHACYALAGRPFGRDPTLLWGQHYLVDLGETIGETLGIFRAAFFTEEDNPWDPSGRAKDYTFRKKMQPKLSRMLQHRSTARSGDDQ